MEGVGVPLRVLLSARPRDGCEASGMYWWKCGGDRGGGGGTMRAYAERDFVGAEEASD